MDGRRSLLLIDDEDSTLEMLAVNLCSQYDVRSARDGKEALARCVEALPDLVILDVDMPGMSGYDTCRSLKASYPELPVVFHSAKTSIDERLLGYAAGGDDYLPKPFDPSELSTKVALQLSRVDRAREMAVQLDEAMNAAMSTADVVGEAGVALDFQRTLNSCRSYAAVAEALFEALQAYGYEGCLQLKGRRETLSLNAKTQCSALEQSLLEHVSQLTGAQRVRSMGPHTGFAYGSVTLFVQDLPLDRSALDPAAADKAGRALDNIALLVEATTSRLAALDNEMNSHELAEVHQLIQMTRRALSDIASSNRRVQSAVRGQFEEMQHQFEESFLHLGLTGGQEDHINSLIADHRDRLLDTLSECQSSEEFLGRVIRKLGAYI
ncbi:MAG TPA: response regulator [Burkholderiaceae bacterium]|nr:response regulator [Burkholderiaceae bacterium]